MKPKISVITPCYNAASTIGQAIATVVAQNYPNFEHIVADGGSVDGTFDIIKKHQHLKWISERDQGQADAMNKGFDLARGELIVYLNADDEFAPGVFQRVAELYEQHKSDKFMLLMDLKVREANGLEWTAVPSVKFSEIADPAKMMFPYNPISYFYHRKVQEVTGKFPLGYKYAMDYWFLLKAYKLADLHYEPVVAGTFNNFNNKTSSRKASDMECLKVLIDHYKKSIPVLGIFHPQAIRAKRMLKKLATGAG